MRPPKRRPTAKRRALPVARLSEAVANVSDQIDEKDHGGPGKDRREEHVEKLRQRHSSFFMYWTTAPNSGRLPS